MDDKMRLDNEITDFNLAYVKLAQRLLFSDPAIGKEILGISDVMAERIAAMTAEEIKQLAESGELVCRFRDDIRPGMA